MQRVLIINCFETYEQRAEILLRHFQELGCEAKVITSDWLHMGKAVRKSCPEDYEMLHVKPYFKNLSPQRLMSHHGFAKAALEKIEQYAPDLLWVFIPPNSLAKTAAQYKKAHPEVKLVLDFIDMWPETMPISRFKSLPPFSNWRDLRDRYVESADALVTECKLYHTILTKITDKPLHTLYLTRRFAPCPDTAAPTVDRIGLCYLGSINNIIDIPCITDVIRRIDAPVDLHIIGDGENRENLIGAAKEAGAQVHFHGKIYDLEKKREIADRCHLGLNIMKSNVFVGLTMKSMDYFELSLPILNNIRGDTWDFVDEYGIGLNATPETDLRVENILRLQENKRRVYEFGRSKFDISAFTRDLNEILALLNV